MQHTVNRQRLKMASSPDQLLADLHSALQSEDKYTPHIEYLQFSEKKSGEVTVALYNNVVDRLRCLNLFYKLSPETFFQAVNIMGRFLSIVKARSHHIMCVGTCCFYMAVKTIEQPKNHMCAKHLLRISQCGASLSDLSRMERIILEKLHYDIQGTTANTFLQIFHSFCKAKNALNILKSTWQEFLERVTRKLEASMCHFAFVHYKSSVKALSLLTYELADFARIHSKSNEREWARCLLALQLHTRMSDCELLQCKSLMREFLDIYASSECKRPHSKLSWTVSMRTAKQIRMSCMTACRLPSIPENEAPLLRTSDAESLITDSSSDDNSECTSPPTDDVFTNESSSLESCPESRSAFLFPWKGNTICPL
ncbi:cyclin-G1-like [Anneissia japonica]|uniref:cyclin-G1-like n=1 Tax=Anneissia japonica TaxID=1529436 RepID=UPI0014257217|nr:cyclin-G1-like [Anneissia japonica]